MRHVQSGLKEYSVNPFHCAHWYLPIETSKVFSFVESPSCIYFKMNLVLSVLNRPYFSHHNLKFASGSIRGQNSG